MVHKELISIVFREIISGPKNHNDKDTIMVCSVLSMYRLHCIQKKKITVDLLWNIPT